MNRQVLPSMLLSVFIVCFFAVVLRPVEPNGGRIVAETPIPSPSSEPIAEAPVAVGEAPQQPVEAPPPVPEPEAPPVARLESTPEAAISASPPEVATPVVAAPPARSTPPETAPVVHVAPRVVKPAPAPRLDERAEIRIASTPAPRRSPPPAPTPVPEPEPAPEAEPAKEIEVTTIPRGEPESTVAGEGETLEDVALRVYGTRAAIATLRDANRGLAGRLRPGALLWTPPR